MLLLLAAISCFSIPFTNNFYVQCTLWGVLGMSVSASWTTLLVYIFRKWTDRATVIHNSVVMAHTIGMITCPLLINLSESLFGARQWWFAMLIFPMFYIFGAITLWTLPTPQHDRLRSIDVALRNCESRDFKDAVTVELEMKPHQSLKIAILTCFALCNMVTAIAITGSRVHITVFCEEYLGVSSSIGRYLLAVSECGTIFCRFMIFVVDYVRARNQRTGCFHSDSMKWAYLWITLITIMVMTCLWIVTPFKYQVPMLFVIFSVNGFSFSAWGIVFFGLIEPVIAVNGFISCCALALYGVGAFVIVWVNGVVIEHHGVRYIPITLLIGLVLGVPVLLCWTFLHRKYMKIQSAIINSTPTSVPQVNDHVESGEYSSPTS